MEGPVSRRRFFFFNRGKKMLERPIMAPLCSFFWSSLRSQKLLGKPPWPPLAPLAPLVSAGPGPLYCQSTPFSKSKENMVYILSTLPLYAGVLLKFRIPLCPHCLCLCNKQYEKYGKQRHEKILQKLKTHTKYLKLGARSLRLKNKPQRY